MPLSAKEFLTQRWAESFLQSGHRGTPAEIKASLGRLMAMREETDAAGRRLATLQERGRLLMRSQAREKASRLSAPLTSPSEGQDSTPQMIGE